MCLFIFFLKPIATVAIFDSSRWFRFLRLKILTCFTVLYQLNRFLPPTWSVCLTRLVLVNAMFCFYFSPSHHYFFFLLCFHPCSKLVSKRRKAHLRRLDRRWTLGGIVNRQQSRGEWIASCGNSPKGTLKTTLPPQLLCTWVLPRVSLPRYTARGRLKLQSSDVCVIYEKLRVSWSQG